MDNPQPVKNDKEEILLWAEFCAWTMLVMTPIIWWLQGPSVSADQFVVRTALVVISATAAIGLRGRALLSRRHIAARGQVATSLDHNKPEQGLPGPNRRSQAR